MLSLPCSLGWGAELVARGQVRSPSFHRASVFCGGGCRVTICNTPRTMRHMTCSPNGPDGEEGTQSNAVCKDAAACLAWFGPLTDIAHRHRTRGGMLLAARPRRPRLERRQAQPTRKPRRGRRRPRVSRCPRRPCLRGVPSRSGGKRTTRWAGGGRRETRLARPRRNKLRQFPLQRLWRHAQDLLCNRALAMEMAALSTNTHSSTSS